MKKLRYLALIVIAAGFAAGCDTNDDGFYNETLVEIPNLISIETRPNYFVGERLYVNATFSRYLNEPGQATPLDIFQSTNRALNFDYSYTVERKVGTEWQVVEFPTASLDIEQGGVNNINVLYVNATYDPATENYRSRIGLPLDTPGEYRLHFDTESDAPNEAELRSRSIGNNLTLTIVTSVAQVSNDGFYSFTVN